MDYLPRLKLYLLIVAVGFSGSTALSYFARNFIGLVWPRLLFGFFSACLTPALIRLIALYFPPNLRGVAYGLFMISVYAGSSIASLSIVLCSFISWDLVLLGIGIISGGVSVIFGLLLKDSRNISEVTDKGSLREDAKELVKNRTLVLSLVAMFFRYCGGFGRGFFDALYFTGQFPDSKQIYAVCNAIALLLVPIVLYFGGKITDIKEAQGKLRVRPLLCCITSLIPVPFLCVMYTVDSLGLAMASLFIVCIVGETYISVSMAVIINVTTPRVRALRKCYIESGVSFAIAFIGGTLSALVLGAVNTSHENLRIGLLSVVATCYFIGGVTFYFICRVYPQDYKNSMKGPAPLMDTSTEQS